jgi:hypothetical protein
MSDSFVMIKLLIQLYVFTARPPGYFNYDKPRLWGRENFSFLWEIYLSVLKRHNRREGQERGRKMNVF